MKFYIKPKHFAQHRSFKVRDESQGELFKIKGKFFLGLQSLLMKDMNDQVLYIAKRRFSLKFYRIYEIMNETGEKLARVHRTYGWFRPRYSLFTPNENIRFEGSIYQHAFSLHDASQKLAQIEKRVFSFGDAYEIEVFTEKRPLLQLFLVIVIDQMNHERKKFRS